MPLIVIPCRAGSTELPEKNFKSLGGQPLWTYTTAVARGLRWPYVLTTDKRGWGLMGDQTMYHRTMIGQAHGQPMFKIVKEVADRYEGDPIVLLQPTSPFRKVDTVMQAVKLLKTAEMDSVVAVAKLPKTHCPDYLCQVRGGELLPWDLTREPPTSRQEARQAYIRTGDVYAFWRQTLRMGSLYGHRCHPLVVPYHEHLSIDSQQDWDRAEALMAAKGVLV